MIRLTKSAGPRDFGRIAMRGFRFGLLSLALLVGPATNWTPSVVGADVTTAATASTAGSISQGLRRILDGNLESNATLAVSDLRAMQGHVRGLSEKLKKCTVGVRVDNDRGSAWGSGVIISKDGYVLTAAHVAG